MFHNKKICFAMATLLGGALLAGCGASGPEFDVEMSPLACSNADSTTTCNGTMTVLRKDIEGPKLDYTLKYQGAMNRGPDDPYVLETQAVKSQRKIRMAYEGKGTGQLELADDQLRYAENANGTTTVAGRVYASGDEAAQAVARHPSVAKQPVEDLAAAHAAVDQMDPQQRGFKDFLKKAWKAIVKIAGLIVKIFT